jgi:integrase
MPPRKRSPENVGLPKRWSFRHGAYYYQVPEGLRHMWDGKALFRLGGSLAQAHAEYAKRVAESEKGGEVRTIGDLLDKYELRVIPTLSETNKTASRSHIRALRRVFQDYPLKDLEPIDCYKYYDSRSAKVSAKHEIGLLKSACQYAIQWGDIKAHPIKDVKIKGQNSVAERYVTDDEIRTVLNHADRSQFGTKVCQAYIKLKLLTGIRKSDLLKLTRASITDDGLELRQGKTGKGIVFEWSDALHMAVDESLAARPNKESIYLFCNRAGGCYVDAHGKAGTFDNLWTDFMGRVRAELTKQGKTLEHFTEHDLRGKVGSDAESDERAAQLLDHSTTAVTRKHYRRRLKVVKPAA